MLRQATTTILLVAIAVQAVFGVLQDSVSICLGGGHKHEVAEVVEQCEMECRHHSEWPTPISNTEDIDDCSCTDFKFALINLLSVPRDTDETPSLEFVFLPSSTPISVVCPSDSTWQTLVDYPPGEPGERRQLFVVRTTRLII